MSMEMEQEDIEELESLVEDIEADEGEDYGEFSPFIERASSRRRRPPPRTARPGGYAPPPSPPGTFVTQAQFRAGLDRVARDVRTNSDAIKAVNRRLSATAERQDQAIAKLAKGVQGTRREVQGLRRDFQRYREMATLLPLLLRPPTTDATTGLEHNNIPEGTKLLREGDTMDQMLPMMLLGMDGFGSSNASSDGGMGGGLGILPMALILSRSGRP